MSTARQALAAVTALVSLAMPAACTTTTNGTPSALPPSSSSPGSHTSAPDATPSETAPLPAGCQTSYAQADPGRPRLVLDFTVSEDLETATGRERIEFTPDKPITELVFRLTANTAPTVKQGNKIEITSAVADHGGRAYTFSRAGAAASTQGGLLHIPFAQRIGAGTRVSADIAFTLTLGDDSFDRFGRTDSDEQRYAWFASAHPLLSWERGYGWHTEDLLQFTAESATSEAMDTDLRVTAPAELHVLGSGSPTPSTPVNGVRTWSAHLDAARDVSVAVGPFSVTTTDVDGVALQVGAYSEDERDALLPEFGRAIRELTALLGPFPFPSLSVARVPAGGGGIEYPAAILMLDGSRLVSVHETAHQWFYAMVGNSQAQHAWLDEAFASWAEELVDGEQEDSSALQEPGPVDRDTDAYGKDERGYYFITYNKGAAALQAARKAAGAAQFDAAVRCYINTNAWQVADPSDVEQALAHVPKAVDVLEKAGALP